MRLSSSLYKNFLVLTVAAMAIAAVAATPAYAGKRTTTPAGTCLVTPNPTSWGAQYWVVGAGLTPGIPLEIHVSSSVLFSSVAADGTFAAWAYANFLYTGTKTVNVYRMGDSRMKVLATCTFWSNGLY